MSNITTETKDPTEDRERRQCARCRRHFAVAEGTHPMELIGWWTCPTCTESLLPVRHRQSKLDRQEPAT